MKKEKILSVLKRGLCGIIAAVVVVGGMPAVEAKAARDSYQVDISGTMYRSEVPKFLELLNNERVSQGLQPLVLDAKAMAFAEYRAMETTFLTGHTMLSGDLAINNPEISINGFTISQGECYAENALGSRTSSASSIFNDWMNSPGHRNILLNSSSNTRMGFAVYSGGDSSISDYGKQTLSGIFVLLEGSDYVPYDYFENVSASRSFSVPQNYLYVNNEYLGSTTNA